MIRNLKIKNYTLIDSLDVDFKRGFSVITGETGAGKSIILGALGLLLGQRADIKAIKAGEQRCVIEAHFDLEGYDMASFFEDNELDYDEHDCILRRELTAAGKSRAFINDTPVPLAVLKELGEQLVDIHSQHQNLLIRDNSFQLNVVDIIANDSALLLKYREAYDAYRKEQKHLDDLREAAQRSSDQEDYMRFQHEELFNAMLDDPDEQDALEQKAKLMSHTEDIKTALYTADRIVCGDDGNVLGNLRSVGHSLSSIIEVCPDAGDLAERVDSVKIELEDIAAEINSMLDKVDYDPTELERINDRLSTIYSLQKKHHCDSIEQLIAMRDKLAAELDAIDNSDELIAEQEQKVQKALENATKIADELTKQRTKAATKVEKEMTSRLIPLGIPKVRFQVEITRNDILSHNGRDNISFLFSANSSTTLQPVSQVASGGEIARVMLSLKALISNAVSMPTIIFDEIDTGVSGKIAEAMAVIMQEMGNANRQVISITHLPQIASRGSEHYKVMKTETPEGTKTHMTHLDYNERVSELAQMLSGSNITDAAMAQAKELLGV